MSVRRRIEWMACTACFAMSVLSQAESESLIDMNNPSLRWGSHRSADGTCVLTGTAVSELRDDAFELQFRRSPGQKLKLFVLIPGLAKGGTIFMEAPTTHDRWKIFSDNYTPALDGDKAESLRRNVTAGIPLLFTFEYPSQRVKYETVPTGALVAAARFTTCVDELELETPKAANK